METTQASKKVVELRNRSTTLWFTLTNYKPCSSLAKFWFKHLYCCLHLQAFAAFDREGMGLVSKEDLHQIINAFCFVMSDKQFQVNHCL